MSLVQFAAGPGDSGIRNNEIGGYQPYSRVGETVMNATIMPSEWANAAGNSTFAQWASATPGMVAVAPKARSKLSLRAPGGETTAPCIVSVPKIADNPTKLSEMEEKYMFRGIVRSPCVRSEDEMTMGPSVDEYFTLAIGGAATILNNGTGPIDAGDLVRWTFDVDGGKPRAGEARGLGLGPARVAVKKVDSEIDNNFVIGRALSSAKAGQHFDMMIKY